MRKLTFLLTVFLFAASAPAENTSALDSTWSLIPQIELENPSTLVLKNRRYTVPYSNSQTGIPIFQMQVAKEIWEHGAFEFFLVGGAGYGYQSGDFEFADAAGNAFTSRLGLHVVPFSGGVKVRYSIPGFPLLKPSFETRVGGQWFLQSGALEGLNDSFLLPYIVFAPSVTFMDSEHPNGDWFGGFNFGMSYQSSFATVQSLNGWSFDLSMNILLF